MVDTNFFPISRSPARRDLWSYFQKGAIRLASTDVMGTELARDLDPDRRFMLEAQAGELPEFLGPAVYGHSRFGHSVFAAPRDEKLLDEVIGLLFDGKARRDLSEHDVRDAMHVATSARYGFDAFVTEDRNIHRRDARVRDSLHLRLWTPEQALGLVTRVEHRRRIRLGLD